LTIILQPRPSGAGNLTGQKIGVDILKNLYYFLKKQFLIDHLAFLF